MNKIELIGRVSNEPELITTEKGTSITAFNVAVNRRFKNNQGEYDTDFFTCKAFGKLAETIVNYVKKGDRLGLTGSVYFSKYQDKEGNNRTSTQVSVDEIDFLEPRKEVKEEIKEETDPFKDFGDELEVSDELLDDDELPF